MYDEPQEGQGRQPNNGSGGRMATENRNWGYRRGALSNLGHSVARGTIAKILKRHGLEPASGFAKRLERVLRPTLGTDRGGRFLPMEVWTLRGLQRVPGVEELVSLLMWRLPKSRPGSQTSF